MSIKNSPPSMSVEEYLDFEERASERHELVCGTGFAMSPVTIRHNIIAGNIFALLKSHVRGSRCSAMMSNIKLHVEAVDSIYYPDVMVSCGDYRDDSLFAANPVLIVEVLSQSTAAIDCREKVQAYRQIGSLSEYMIVRQTRPSVILHRRRASGDWQILEFNSNDQQLSLESLQAGSMKLSFDDIYENVDWSQKSNHKAHRDANFRHTIEDDPYADY